MNLMFSHLMHSMATDGEIYTMRTTLDIDDDVLPAIKSLARQTNRTAGQVLSALARQALTTSPAAQATGQDPGVGGFVPFGGARNLVTNEQIDRLREQDAY